MTDLRFCRSLAPMTQTVVYTDGACSGNPGPGGWASVLALEGQEVRELGGFEPATTNNRMELLAIIKAVLAMPQQPSHITLYSDSAYALRGITQWRHGWKKRGWLTADGKEVSNRDLWQQVDELLKSPAQRNRWTWKYIPGHKGFVGNERCDEISVAFSQGDHPYLYRGPLVSYQYDLLTLPPDYPLPEMKGSSSKPPGPSHYLSYVDGVLLKHKDWPSCQSRVNGRSGAKFKKISSDEEAHQILKSWGLPTHLWDTL